MTRTEREGSGVGVGEGVDGQMEEDPRPLGRLDGGDPGDRQGNLEPMKL